MRHHRFFYADPEKKTGFLIRFAKETVEKPRKGYYFIRHDFISKKTKKQVEHVDCS